MKPTTLRVVKDEPKQSTEFKPTDPRIIAQTIGRDYVAPKVKMPHFERDVAVNERPGHLRNRLAELIVKDGVETQVKVSGLRRWVMGRIK